MVFTIGHSNRTAAEFLEILLAYGVESLIDVRSLPGSRANPHFDQENLRDWLSQVGIRYRYFEKLGGRRPRDKNSELNAGWRHPAFRGYADYMQTVSFGVAIDRLTALAVKQRVALMCAEAVPWRCHRGLIADALLVRRIEVIDIVGLSQDRIHRLPDWARVSRSGRLTYPAI